MREEQGSTATEGTGNEGSAGAVKEGECREDIAARGQNLVEKKVEVKLEGWQKDHSELPVSGTSRQEKARGSIGNRPTELWGCGKANACRRPLHFSPPGR